MSKPTWKSVEAPPPGIVKADPKPARASWPAPVANTRVATGTPSPPGMSWPPAEGDTRTCLKRPEKENLTDCGRFVSGFGSIVPVTEDISEVTCSFCQWRIEHGTARVLH